MTSARLRRRRRWLPAPGPDDLDAPEAVLDHYRSVDSAPAHYALNRSPAAVNGFLLAFTAASMIALLAVTALVSYTEVDDSRDLVVFAAPGERPALPIRLFVLVFFVVFSLSLATNLWRRLLLLVELCGGVLFVALATDLIALALNNLVGLSLPVVIHQLVGAAVALGLFPWLVLRHAHLPDPVPLPPPQLRGRIRAGTWLRLLVPLAIAITVAGLLESQFHAELTAVRDVALIGGVGPGVFLVQQLLALLAGGVGVVLVSRSRRNTFAPSIAVLVPAHNEAHGIAQTVAALDHAAAAYAGSVHLYVVDNASSDTTAKVARGAIDRSGHLEGALLSCPEPGKARALNYGLERIQEPFVLRVDADVLMGVNGFDLAMRHFADPRVGVVGGIPVPAQVESFIDRARVIEVLLRHGFFQVARMGYDGIAGEPGMFSAYRRTALDQAGPIASGLNGEDTDICLRINALGYRCVVDPRVVYYSETPRSWAHLREQRTRWFRSAYHVAAHNRHALLRPVSMAGAVVMPFALWNAARRAMLAPVLIFAVLVLGVFSHTFTGLRWQPLVALLIAIPAMFGAALCILLGRPRAILYLPEYLVFRVIRSYFTLAALLSLRFPPLESPFARLRGRTASRAAHVRRPADDT